ncbi:MAG: SDR family oxidoreductase [Chloroflexota bacterium]
MDLGLKGKTALVTAASKGLGYATAEQLLAEGASVMICGRSEESLAHAVGKLKEAFGDDVPVASIAADVMEESAAQTLVDATVKAFGGLDILVTNAGGPPAGTLDSTPIEQWQKGFDLTVMSAVRLVMAAGDHLKASDAAAILTITSVSVKFPVANLMLSNVIRPAVIGLTKALAQEWGPMGVRANSILPGYTRTDRIEYLLNQWADERGTTPDEEAAKLGARVPLKRIGTAEEFGKVACFLCSPAASYVTGEMVLVDGGAYPGLM